MTTRERNTIVRRLRADLPVEDLRRSDHVAVLAVAAGERLGLSDPQLLDLRYAAELQSIGAWPGDLPFLERAKAIRDATSTLEFELLRGANLVVMLLENSSELRPEDLVQIEPKAAEALLSVQKVIQPVS